MYSLDDLKQVFKEPKEVPREINRLFYTRGRQWKYNKKAESVFDKDWDNLLILDACRYDAFKQTSPDFDLPGKLEVNYSRGAGTIEFLEANVDGEDLSDVVYVTGTTMVYRNTVLNDNVDHNLHDVVDVWENAIDVGEWGVRPDRMAEAAKDASEKYPDKRIVVHFIQPHIPFIGEFGEEEFGDVGGSIWRKLRRGELDADDQDLWRAYIENLECVLPAAKELLTEMQGKNVITADHGQLLGERGFPIPIKDYGHPSGIYCKELVKVPWHVYQNGPRKDTTAEARDVEYNEKDRKELDDMAEEHLRNLGYL